MPEDSPGVKVSAVRDTYGAEAGLWTISEVFLYITCVYIHIYVYVYTCIYIYISMYVCMFVCMYVCMQVGR